MSKQPKSAFNSHPTAQRSPARSGHKETSEVHRITGASESVVADSERKNRIYAILIGVRIVSVFMVLFTDGWLQIAILVGGMLAPWVGVQIANNIRQVRNESTDPIAPQQAALAAAPTAAAPAPEDTVLIGEYVTHEHTNPTAPSQDTAGGRDAQRS